jgi:hypothetical protein
VVCCIARPYVKKGLSRTQGTEVKGLQGGLEQAYSIEIGRFVGSAYCIMRFDLVYI